MTANFVVTFFQEAITVAGMLPLPALLLACCRQWLPSFRR